MIKIRLVEHEGRKVAVTDDLLPLSRMLLRRIRRWLKQ